MRALVITSMSPLRNGLETRGATLRFRLFVEAIREIAEKVDVLHFVSPKFIAAHPSELIMSAKESEFLGFPVSAHMVACRPVRRPPTFVNHYLAGVFSIYEQEEFFSYAGMEQISRLTALLDHSPSLVFVHRLRAMIPMLRSGRRHPRIFFDLDDVLHRVRAQFALQPPLRPGKLGYLCHTPAIALAERKAATISRRTFICSEPDRVRLQRLVFPRIEVVPNAIAMPEQIPNVPDEPTILFVGACDYLPNILAAERLARGVFPRVRRSIPEARLVIAGKDSLELPSALRPMDGVHYLGYVPELAPLYASSRVVCCPIATGSGTRLKVIEAAAYGRAIVSTAFAAEGLELQDGQNILFRESDDAIADGCVALLRSDVLCRQLGAAARARVEVNYEKGAVRQRVVDLLYQEIR
jgi:glycosyltransferase involved in cell wall biosynthesis